MDSFDFRQEVPQAFPVLNEKQIAVIAEFAEHKLTRTAKFYSAQVKRILSFTSVLSH